MTIDGIINLNKPRDKTSFQMVSLIKRLSRERRIGHAGTLDPIATGVLPICLGKATRLVEFLQDGRKVYQAEIEFGITTDSYDCSGNILSKSDGSSLTRNHINDALAKFHGAIFQSPPPFSAVKYKGKPLYYWARAGLPVPSKIRTVMIFNIAVQAFEPPILDVRIECSKGTYIRSLAHNLGQEVGCGACLNNLVRLQNGPFGIEESVDVLRVEKAFRGGAYEDVVQSMDIAVLHLPSISVNSDMEQAIYNGNSVMVSDVEPEPVYWCRAYSADGRLIALLHYDDVEGLWHPKKVLAGPINAS